MEQREAPQATQDTQVVTVAVGRLQPEEEAEEAAPAPPETVSQAPAAELATLRGEQVGQEIREAQTWAQAGSAGTGAEAVALAPCLVELEAAAVDRTPPVELELAALSGSDFSGFRGTERQPRAFACRWL